MRSTIYFSLSLLKALANFTEKSVYPDADFIVLPFWTDQDLLIPPGLSFPCFPALKATFAI